MKLPDEFKQEALEIIATLRDYVAEQQRARDAGAFPLFVPSAAEKAAPGAIPSHLKKDACGKSVKKSATAPAAGCTRGEKILSSAPAIPMPGWFLSEKGRGRKKTCRDEPFVGKAGQLLTRMIQAIQLDRNEVYIANVVKCRPPDNRDPQEDEIATCLPFLKKQLAVIQPRIVCTLGRFSTQALLGTKEGITKLRGRFQRLENGIMVMPTYHPSFLLRSPEKKREAWEDLQKVQKEYQAGP